MSEDCEGCEDTVTAPESNGHPILRCREPGCEKGLDHGGEHGPVVLITGDE